MTNNDKQVRYVLELNDFELYNLTNDYQDGMTIDKLSIKYGVYFGGISPIRLMGDIKLGIKCPVCNGYLSLWFHNNDGGHKIRCRSCKYEYKDEEYKINNIKEDLKDLKVIKG